MTEISINLSCPSCGGTIKAPEGEKFTRCEYCDAILYLEGDENIFQIMFQNKLQYESAIEAIKRWWKKGFKARDLPKKATITELYPIYVPFWRLSARAAGWVCGYKRVTYKSPHGHLRTKTVYLEKMVFRDFNWTHIACDAGDIGVKTLRNLTGDVVIHDEGSIPTFEPTTSSTDAFKMGLESIHEMAVESANVPNITYKKIHVIPRTLTLIYYPIWIGRYKYGERTYFATLDGVTGDALAGRAPGDPLYQSGIMTGAAFISGLMIGAAWRFAPFEDITIIATIIGVGIASFAFYQFRYGKEVVEGDVEAPVKRAKYDIKKIVEEYLR